MCSYSYVEGENTSQPGTGMSRILEERSIKGLLFSKLSLREIQT